MKVYVILCEYMWRDWGKTGAKIEGDKAYPTLEQAKEALKKKMADAIEIDPGPMLPPFDDGKKWGNSDFDGTYDYRIEELDLEEQE